MLLVAALILYAAGVLYGVHFAALSPMPGWPLNAAQEDWQQDLKPLLNMMGNNMHAHQLQLLLDKKSCLGTSRQNNGTTITEH
jgi:hypothetical protein